MRGDAAGRSGARWNARRYAYKPSREGYIWVDIDRKDLKLYNGCRGEGRVETRDRGELGRALQASLVYLRFITSTNNVSNIRIGASKPPIEAQREGGWSDGF